MAQTKSMTRNQNHDIDSSSKSYRRKRFKSFDRGGVGLWSDLNHDVLLIVMMQLGFIDFFAFSQVCKSWRSLALLNRNVFMVSRPPMCIVPRANSYFCLEDSEGRRFSTISPHSDGRRCVGITCGYVILFGRETRDFWLVNPITRHELHFPHYPLDAGAHIAIRAILVFSPSMSGLVFVVSNRKLYHYTAGEQKILFCIAGKQGWNHVSSILPMAPVIDLHYFKGKIYTLHMDCSLRELRPNLNQWTLLETNKLREPYMLNPRLVSSNENLYVINWLSKTQRVKELEFGELKWVSLEKTIGEYLCFISYYSNSAAIKLESWRGPQIQYNFSYESGRHNCYYQSMWYFFHDCLNVNILNE